MSEPKEASVSDIIPGFDAGQSFALRTIAREAARAAVEEYSRKECTLVCPRMDSVETVLFGRSEQNIVGLDDRVRQLERFEARVAKLTWVVVAQTIVLLGGIASAALFLPTP